MTARANDDWIIRYGKKIRPALNRWIARNSLIATTPVLAPASFAWTDHLEANWHDIQRECDELLAERDAIPPLSEVSPHHRRIDVENRWKSFFFEAHGFQVEANRARCPCTAELLDQIPGLVTAFYSVMEPGAHVPRHKGITKALVNVHLGLRVPAGVEHCRICIDGEDYGWEEGRLFFFDDTFKHEVWNDSDRPRAILFIQVMRPMTRLATILGKTVIGVVNRTSYIRDARKKLGATRSRRSPRRLPRAA